MSSADEATPLIYRDEADTEDVEGSTLSDGTKAKRDINTWQLVVIIYFCVSGGPFGNEGAVQAGGVGWCLAITALSSFIFNVPMALGVAELASAMPENGGFIVWVSRAFGPVAGFLEGYTAWASDVFDNSLYPVLFSTYLETAIYGENDVWPQSVRYLVRFSVVGFCTICNILGLQAVGTVSLIFTVITLAPFAFMCVYSIPDLQPSRWIAFEDNSSVHWGLLLSTVLWANSGWDAPGTVAGCVYKPKETYPRAIFISVFLVLATNFFPIAVGSAYLTDSEDWSSDEGFWAYLGQLVAGKYLAYAIIISGIVSNLALLNVCLATTAWGLYAICLPGLLDIESITRIHHRFRTPITSIVLNATAVALGCLFDFSFLVQIDQTLCCFSLILGDFALIWLRVIEPDRERPFKIPLGTVGLALFMLPHIIVCAALAFAIDHEAQIIVLVTMVLGAIVYVVCRCLAHYKEEEGFAVKDIGKVFDNIPEILEERYGTVVNEEDLPDLGLGTSVVVETIPVTVALDAPASAAPRSETDDEVNPQTSSQKIDDEEGTTTEHEKKRVAFNLVDLKDEDQSNVTENGETHTNGVEEKASTPVKKPNSPFLDSSTPTYSPSGRRLSQQLLQSPQELSLLPNSEGTTEQEAFLVPESTGQPSPRHPDDSVRGKAKRSSSRRRRVQHQKSLFGRTQKDNDEITTPESEKGENNKTFEDKESDRETDSVKEGIKLFPTPPTTLTSISTDSGKENIRTPPTTQTTLSATTTPETQRRRRKGRRDR